MFVMKGFLKRIRYTEYIREPWSNFLIKFSIFLGDFEDPSYINY